ncbi:TolC family outer membrane protein [Pelagibacteraceae bacterium]|nr:TolC family outer membrane protein [Pelagibacteraceae bacterium]
MKIFFTILIFFLHINFSHAEDSLIFFVESAYKNNPKLNSERKNLKAIKENVNISRSEFLPSITLTKDVDSTESSNKTNQSGVSLPDSSINKESQSISVDQKIFQGFQGYNSVKKSKLEFDKANFELKQVEQEIILGSASVYFDLIYKSENKKFNLANVDLFERQVESDSARLQKGEITLTDIAQSESSLAGARAKLIAAQTELLTTKTNFKRITRLDPPKKIKENYELEVNLPKNLKDALTISEKNNPKLAIAKVNLKISEKNVSIERAQLSPSASINYSKSETSDLSATIDNADQESLKATVTWPIIKGGKNFSSLKKSKFNKEKTDLIFEDINNEVKTETTNAWSIYQSAESVLKSTEAQVKAAEIANEGITSEYDSGNTRTTLEVIQSRSLLLDARIANAKAERDYVISKFKLLSAIGDLTLENVKNS